MHSTHSCPGRQTEVAPAPAQRNAQSAAATVARHIFRRSNLLSGMAVASWAPSAQIGNVHSTRTAIYPPVAPTPHRRICPSKPRHSVLAPSLCLRPRLAVQTLVVPAAAHCALPSLGICGRPPLSWSNEKDVRRRPSFTSCSRPLYRRQPSRADRPHTRPGWSTRLRALYLWLQPLPATSPPDWDIPPSLCPCLCPPCAPACARRWRW